MHLPLLPALLAAACAPAPPPDAPADVVLVFMAGLRADAPGEPAAENAFLDGLDLVPSVRFANAYVQSPSPLVCLGSVLTGHYPSAIPLCGLTTRAPDASTPAPWCASIPGERRTLPDVLGLYGYETAFFRSHVHGAEQVAGRFGGGADVSGSWDTWATPWEDLQAAATAWWEEKADHPRLLVVATGDLMMNHRPEVVAEMGISLQAPPSPEPGPGEQKRREAVYRVLGEESRRVGARIRTLLDGLESSPARPRFVFVTSTSGLNVGERTGAVAFPRDFFFYDVLLDRTVHVPLWVFGPGRARKTRSVAQPVELLDLAPTTFALAHAVPLAGLPGQDLLDPTFAEDEDAIAYVEFGDQILLRWRSWVLAMRAMLHHDTSLDPQLTEELLQPLRVNYSLFDVVSDPMQVHNLLMPHPLPPPVQGRGRPAQTLPGRPKDAVGAVPIPKPDLPPDVDPSHLATARTMRDRMIAVRTGPGATPAEVDPSLLQQLRLTPSEGYW